MDKMVRNLRKWLERSSLILYALSRSKPVMEKSSSPMMALPSSSIWPCFTLPHEWYVLNQIRSSSTHSHLFQLVELSQAQDIEAGDGTTSVVVLAGSLLSAAEKLLAQGIHPTTVAQSFQNAASKAVEFLEGMSMPVDLNDRESLLRAARTSLNSKVGQYAFLKVVVILNKV